MKWISVKDKLPINFPDMCEQQGVLVFCERDGMPLVSIAQFRENKWEVLNNEGILDCEWVEGFYSNDVTHWSWIGYPRGE